MAQLSVEALNGHAADHPSAFSPPPPPLRFSLPSRAVTPANIEDAYMAFIFYCNPALPADCDTASLREAFRNPPRSGGKVFDPFTIYDLVRRFYDKDIRTWTELTMKLGVDPPDPAKEESVQKIAQYGVRLKKWLHSMHVKAFFEYLMGVENDYWTNVPIDSSPTAVPTRDGIAVEDDMALRALLPHIRPKRGRKRPEPDEVTKGTAQRRRTSPLSAVDGLALQTSWPDGDAQSTPVDVAPMSSAGTWHSHGALQTPLTSLPPTSAMTPSAENGFWADEPRSAMTPPSRAQGSHQRRGAKNVSSAWKLGGDESTKKTRGRPPMTRTPIDTPTTATAAWPPAPIQLPLSTSQVDANDYRTNSMNGSVSEANQPAALAATMQQAQPLSAVADSSQHAHMHSPPRTRQNSADDRPARPSISLQVPQRSGGTIRLATPSTFQTRAPVSQMTQQTATTDSQQATWASVPGEALPSYDNIHAVQPGQPYVEKRKETSRKWASVCTGGDALPPNGSQGQEEDKNIPEYFFERMKDRTNVDAIMAYFIRVTNEAHWYDEDGQPTEGASMEEATAMINATLENMYRTASSSQAFLINLAALAGARMLMTNISRCIRLGEKEDHTAYRCEWEYRFGHLEGYFNMAVTVPFTMWRARRRHDETLESSDMEMGGEADEGSGLQDVEGGCESSRLSSARLQAEHWQNKYKSLLGQVDKMDKELFELRNKVIDSLKPERYP